MVCSIVKANPGEIIVGPRSSLIRSVTQHV